MCRLVDIAELDSLPKRTLDRRFVEVMTPPLGGLGIRVHPRPRKYPLPPPLSARPWILPAQRCRQLDPPRPVAQVVRMLRPHYLELPPQWGLQSHRKHRDPVAVSLATPDADFSTPELEILHPQPKRLHE